MLRDIFRPGFLRRLEYLKIDVRRVYLSTRKGGYESVNKKGTSLEFADYQEYNPGDDFRYIDWNLYGRLNKLLVKTFKEEVELSVHVLLDTSLSMLYPEGDKKYEYSKKIALALAYIGLSSQNSVRIAAINDSSPEDTGRYIIRQTPFFYKLNGIFRIKDFLDGIHPGGEADLQGFLSRYIYENRGRGGSAIIISDFMVPPSSYKRAIDLLRFKNYDVKVIQVLGADELDPFKNLSSGEIIDVETQERKVVNVTGALKKKYHKLLSEHNTELRDYCRANKMAYILARTDMEIEDLILRELPRIGFVR
ncbi:MAG: DUF58 domain-containing protein [Planctomycetota bacterium]|jgi:uncharacterized protein (DUF58 family)